MVKGVEVFFSLAKSESQPQQFFYGHAFRPIPRTCYVSAIVCLGNEFSCCCGLVCPGIAAMHLCCCCCWSLCVAVEATAAAAAAAAARAKIASWRTLICSLWTKNASHLLHKWMAWAIVDLSLVLFCFFLDAGIWCSRGTQQYCYGLIFSFYPPTTIGFLTHS